MCQNRPIHNRNFLIYFLNYSTPKKTATRFRVLLGLEASPKWPSKSEMSFKYMHHRSIFMAGYKVFPGFCQKLSEALGKVIMADFGQ